MKLIQNVLKKIGTSIEPVISGDGLNSMPIGQTTPAAGAFTALKASTDPTDDNGVGDRRYNDTRYLISAIPMTAATDPAGDAAVSTAIIDAYSGIIITLTGAGNAQTLQSPTTTTAGKQFTVVSDDGNGANTIEVNSITLNAGEAQKFIWGGSAWVAVTAVDADDIAFISTGRIAATDVQAAIEELDEEATGRCATFIVAANNSSTISKQQADYECDGTDDDVQIQAAIDTLPSTGGMVLLLDGTFNITSTINLSGLKHITLAGLGASTIINNQNATGAHAIKADNAVTDTPSSVRYITIKDMIITGNANSGHGLFFDYCDVLTIDGIIAVENGDHGVSITHNAWTVAADVAYANLTISNSKFLTNGKSGIYLSDLHDLLISSSHFEENSDYGIELGSNCFDLSLNNCAIEDNVDGELYVAGLLKSAYITGNTIEASSGKSGIKIVGSVDRLVIVGNTFDAGGRAIEIRSGSLSVDGMVIASNLFSGQTISSMSLGSPGDSFLNVVIEGNATAYNGSGTAYGIFVNYMDVLTICNNSLTTKGLGIALNSCTHCIVSNNSISAERIGAGTNEHEGIRSLSCENVVIEGNVIQKETATALDEGINLESIAGNHKIVNNNISGATSSISGLTNDCIAHDRYSDLFMDVLAVSATHVRSNEDVSAATPITFTLDAQPDIPRTLSWSFDTHAQVTEYDMEVIGVDAKGNSVTETWDETAGWSGETSNAFATITSIKMTSRTGTGAADTMDIGITDVLGLSNIIYETSDVFKIKKNNANATVATAQVNTTYDTYDMSVITLGAGDDFTIWYKSNLNIIS